MNDGATRFTPALICAGENSFEFGKMFARDRMPVFPERRAAADMVFPEARLRFVNPERNGAAQRRAVVFREQPLFIQAVAGLVHHAVERLRKIPLVVARGQPAIARTERLAERMRGGVHPSGLEVEADRFRDLAVERLLRGDRVMALQIISPASPPNVREPRPSSSATIAGRSVANSARNWLAVAPVS